MVYDKKLRSFDKDMLLAWFERYITAEARCALMAELPEAYNRWMGAEYCAVHKTGAPQGKLTAADGDTTVRITLEVR